MARGYALPEPNDYHDNQNIHKQADKEERQHALAHNSPQIAPADRMHGGFGLRGYNDHNRMQGIRRYDVGVDANDYRPVSAEDIVAFFPTDDEWCAMHGIRREALG